MGAKSPIPGQVKSMDFKGVFGPERVLSPPGKKKNQAPPLDKFQTTPQLIRTAKSLNWDYIYNRLQIMYTRIHITAIIRIGKGWIHITAIKDGERGDTHNSYKGWGKGGYT